MLTDPGAVITYYMYGIPILNFGNKLMSTSRQSSVKEKHFFVMSKSKLKNICIK